METEKEFEKNNHFCREADPKWKSLLFETYRMFNHDVAGRLKFMHLLVKWSPLGDKLELLSPNSGENQKFSINVISTQDDDERTSIMH